MSQQPGELVVEARTLRVAALRDVIQLMKPGITVMSVLVAAGAMAIAARTAGVGVTWPLVLLSLLGVAASVAGAGALNQWLERDLDARMSRTCDRPLPTGRLDVPWAIGAGIVLGVGAIPLLYVAAGPVCAALTALALGLYVLVYTPMKQHSAWAVVVGAVPGAMPALMGYAAVTGSVDRVGLTLFAIVFFWQLPHFLAITVYREKEYRKAGYVVAASVLGLERTRTWIALSAVPMVAVSLLLVRFDVAGGLYGFVAGLLGLWFMRLCVRGFVAESLPSWARRVFFGSLVYQTLLFAALAVDVAWRAAF